MPRPDAQEMREWRERRGLSQRAAAEVLGVSQPTISFIENGRYAPGHKLLVTMHRLDVEQQAVGLAPQSRAWPAHAHRMEGAQFLRHLPDCVPCLARVVRLAPLTR